MARGQTPIELVGMDRRDVHIAFESFGVAVDVDVRHRCDTGACGFDSLDDGVREILPPGAKPRFAPGSATLIVLECSGHTLTVTNAEGITRAFDSLDSGLRAVNQAIRSVIAVEAPGLVFIHAGVVAVNGRAVVFPGRSMAGKTTLVAELVRAGATYLSDEYAVFDGDGLVHPFARRLSVREVSGRREVSVAELGGEAACCPLPVGVVVAVEFQPGASWQVAPADQGACARSLIENAVAARSRPVEVLQVSAKVARSASFVQGVRGDVKTVVPTLMELVHS